jgi:excisionase family DNA binding protein
MEILTALPSPQPRLMGVEAAATYIDVTPRTIQRLIAKGRLMPVRIDGVRRVFVDRCDLDRLIEAAKAGAVGEASV